MKDDFDDFKEQLDLIYDNLWKLYRGKDGKGCDYNISQESFLLNLINQIDDYFER
jgi:hypothetical protein